MQVATSIVVCSPTKVEHGVRLLCQQCAWRNVHLPFIMSTKSFMAYASCEYTAKDPFGAVSFSCALSIMWAAVRDTHCFKQRRKT